MNALNDQQRFAATYSGKHLLVLAGAGTGKTHTIIARAKHLIESGVDPRRILILSFTRKSAAEIVQRISDKLPESKSEGLVGSTFHSWCMSIIKNYPDVFPQAGYTLLDEDDRSSCFKLICGRGWNSKDKGKRKITPDDIANVYSYMVNTNCTLGNAIRMKLFNNAADAFNVEEETAICRYIIQGYIAYKTNRKYMDYDDILLTVSKYLKRNLELRKHIAGLYDHILIDEMQDTNPLQYELMSSFYEDCHLFCVGDDAQSIYSFRGSDFHTIHNFTQIVSGAKVCKLTINYRSTQEILDLANWVIGRSPLNYDKYLTSFRGDGIKPQILHWRDEWEEAESIAHSIIDEFKVCGKKWRDNLVISRSVWGLKKIEGKCIKYKIPYVVYGGNSLMQSRHIRDVVAAMRIVNNFYDEIAWSRYLQLWNGIGEVTASRIIEELLRETSLDNCLMALMNMELQEEIANTLIQLSNLQSDPAKAIEEALPIMSDRLKEIYKDEWDRRKTDFNILMDVAKGTGSISELITEYILNPSLNTKDKWPAKVEDRVILSTIHSAKGLEADNVYVINASTNAYPTPKAILCGEDAIEEERRCLYVALTRAKDKLRIYRDIQTTHISGSDEQLYFLNELPADKYEAKALYNTFMRPMQGFSKQINEEDIYSDFNLE